MPTEAWFKPIPPASSWAWSADHRACRVVLLILKADSGSDREKVIRYGGFALVSVLLTDIHYDMVDRFHMNWQIAS